MFEIPFIQTITIGPIVLYTWGIFVGTGILIAYLFLRKRFQTRQINTQYVDTLALISIIGGFVGARFLWILIEWKYYVQNPLEILAMHHGGLAFSGGFILVAFLAAWYLSRQRLDILELIDIVALPLALGMFIGRFGCLFGELHPGIPTTFGPVYSVNGEFLVAWPLWAILHWAIAIVVLWQIEKRKNIVKGLKGASLILWWSAWRLFGDFLRADEGVVGGDPRFWIFTPTQYIALVVFIAAVIFVVYLCHGKIRRSRKF